MNSFWSRGENFQRGKRTLFQSQQRVRLDARVFCDSHLDAFFGYNPFIALIVQWTEQGTPKA